VKDRECLPCRARRGHGLLARSFLAPVAFPRPGRGARRADGARATQHSGSTGPRVRVTLISRMTDCSYNCSCLPWISCVLCGTNTRHLSKRSTAGPCTDDLGHGPAVASQLARYLNGLVAPHEREAPGGASAFADRVPRAAQHRLSHSAGATNLDPR
jgi:hypothetical protein